MKHPLDTAPCAETPHPVVYPVGGFYPSLSGFSLTNFAHQSLVRCVISLSVRHNIKGDFGIPNEAFGRPLYDHQSVINTKLGSRVYVTCNLIFDLYSLLFVFSNVLTSLDHLRSSLISRKHWGAKLKTTLTGLLTCGRNLVSIR